MSFKKNKYQVVKNVVSKDIAKLAFNYLKIRETAEKKINLLWYSNKMVWDV